MLSFLEVGFVHVALLVDGAGVRQSELAGFEALKSRPLRMSGKYISAWLDHRVAEVSNFSLTGALLVLDEAFPVDTRATLTLSRGSVAVTVEAHILRSDQSASRWLVAVSFFNPTAEAKKHLPQLMTG